MKVTVLGRMFLCFDPYHEHETPLQKVVVVLYDDRMIEVSQDGDKYNVRRDEGPARFGLTWDEVVTWWRGLL